MRLSNPLALTFAKSTMRTFNVLAIPWEFSIMRSGTYGHVFVTRSGNERIYPMIYIGNTFIENAIIIYEAVAKNIAEATGIVLPKTS